MSILEQLSLAVLSATSILLSIAVGAVRARVAKLEVRIEAILETLPAACRVCGCTDEQACWPNGCHWVEPDLCSSCAPDLDEASSLEDLG